MAFVTQGFRWWWDGEKEADNSISYCGNAALVLEKNAEAKGNFDKLSPYRQKEIMRYINNPKTASAIDRNVEKALKHLLGGRRNTHLAADTKTILFHTKED